MKFEDILWYQPAYILLKGLEAEKYYQGKKMPTDIRKAIEETRLGAIWVFGLNKLNNQELYLQPVNEQDPDIRLLFESKSSKSKKYPLWGHWVDVEITRYEEHRSEPLEVHFYALRIS